MKRRLATALAFASLVLTGASKPTLVPDVSARNIQIRYTFAGAQLLLFGAIVYPGGRIPANTPDVVVVVKGPAEPIIVREKRRIAGIWMNAEFEPVPLGPLVLRRRLFTAYRQARR